MSPILLALAAFLAAFGTVALVLVWAPSTRPQRARRLAAVADAQPAAPEAPTAQIPGRPDVIPWLTRLLSGTRIQRGLQAQIIQAGLLLRPAELLVLMGAGAAIGAVAGSVVLQLIGAAAGAVVLGISPWAYIKLRQGIRKKRLMMQLPDALDLICSSLRAGYGFVQAMSNVADQMAPPVSDEARRLADEVGLGLSLDAALQRMMERTGTHDFELICSAVQIQTRTGGNLAEVLGNLSGVIRDRIRLAGEISALTAEGRLSGGILLALPFVFAGILHHLSPGYLTPLLAEPLGHILLGVGVVLMALGVIVINKLLTIDL
ncbi:MAG: type II secretion system F family protein [Armatimonadota bacterium]